MAVAVLFASKESFALLSLSYCRLLAENSERENMKWYYFDLGVGEEEEEG